MNRFDLRKSFNKSTRAAAALALVLYVALTQLPSIFPAAGRAGNTAATLQDPCKPVSTLPQQGAYNGAYFLGFGDAKGCQILGGPGKAYPANQPEVFLHGKFNVDSMQKGKPAVFFSPVDKNFAGPQGTRDVALGLLNFGEGSDASKLAVVDIPTQARTTPQLPGTVYVWSAIPGDPGWHLIGTWTYPITCVDASSTAVQLSPAASVQRGAQQAPAGINVNQINPRPVLFSTGVPVNSGPATPAARRASIRGLPA
ncbi:MAG: hypothetical protein ACREEM_46000 [Blastocatellia bacterium]